MSSEVGKKRGEERKKSWKKERKEEARKEENSREEKNEGMNKLKMVEGKRGKKRRVEEEGTSIDGKEKK